MKNELIKHIRAIAERDRAKILEKAQAEADALLDESKKTSELMRNRARQKVSEEADRLRESRYNSVRFEINARRYELKSAAIDDIWRETEGLIRKIEKSDQYSVIFETLFNECLETAPDGSVVHAFPDDAELVKGCIEKSGRALVFEDDSYVHGGVEFHWPDGKTVLRNTLSHRLSKLKSEGNADFSGLLFSSGEDATV